VVLIVLLCPILSYFLGVEWDIYHFIAIKWIHRGDAEHAEEDAEKIVNR